MFAGVKSTTAILLIVLLSICQINLGLVSASSHTPSTTPPTKHLNLAQPLDGRRVVRRRTVRRTTYRPSQHYSPSRYTSVYVDHGPSYHYYRPSYSYHHSYTHVYYNGGGGGGFLSCLCSCCCCCVLLTCLTPCVYAA